MGSSELRAFLRHSNTKDNLLALRMVALGLDPYEAALSDPALVRHLQKLCTLCDNRECCLQGFTRSSTVCSYSWSGATAVGSTIRTICDSCICFVGDGLMLLGAFVAVTGTCFEGAFNVGRIRGVR
jgi:hypothetical protein